MGQSSTKSPGWKTEAWGGFDAYFGGGEIGDKGDKGDKEELVLVGWIM